VELQNRTIVVSKHSTAVPAIAADGEILEDSDGTLHFPHLKNNGS
jgi:hypothetical protein